MTSDKVIEELQKGLDSAREEAERPSDDLAGLQFADGYLAGFEEAVRIINGAAE